MSIAASARVTHLLKRHNQQQHFGLYFALDDKYRFTVAYNSDKSLWAARPFFVDQPIDLPKTFGISESAVFPKYTATFDNNGSVIITDTITGQFIHRLLSPCADPSEQ